MFKKINIGFIALSFVVTPMLAHAHERQLFQIGGVEYLFVVGSLGEPIVVDDKTGVDLRVVTADPKDPTNASAGGAKPVLGLEGAVKVEIGAGEKKKMFDLTTVYGTPGAYKAVFFPTVKTALSYRFTGVINNTPIDLTFTCAPEGSIAVEDKSEVEMGAGVKRIYKNGQFGCPLGKEELGFPEEGMTVVGLHDSAHHEMEGMKKDLASGSDIALALGSLGVILGCAALWRSRSQKI